MFIAITDDNAGLTRDLVQSTVELPQELLLLDLYPQIIAMGYLLIDPKVAFTLNRCFVLANLICMVD